MPERANPERVNNGCMIYRDDAVVTRRMAELDREVRDWLGILPPRRDPRTLDERGSDA